MLVVLMLEYPGKLSAYFFTGVGQPGGRSCLRLRRADARDPDLRDRHVDLQHPGADTCRASVFLNGNGAQVAFGFLLILGVGIACGLLNGTFAYADEPIIVTITTAPSITASPFHPPDFRRVGVREAQRRAEVRTSASHLTGPPPRHRHRLLAPRDKTRLGTGLYAVGSAGTFGVHLGGQEAGQIAPTRPPGSSPPSGESPEPPAPSGDAPLA